MEPISVGIFLATMGINSVVSFIAGMLTERASTERKITELKRQILALSNKSASIGGRHKKLLCACALYDIALIKASESSNEEVRSLILEFSPVAALLKEGGNGWIERLRIHFQIESVKKKYLDGLKGMAK
ncbi:MAG: hypothetical protein NTZ35_08555 [Ignavibacteriales bacterium]|nr:hypothetical protein [Ignavibacteriales bacterium]